jgi:hypothetical protein
MEDPTDLVRPFRVELDGGEVIESDGGLLHPRMSREPVPGLVLRMPVPRAHALAHLLDDRSRALGVAPPRGFGSDDRVLSRTLEAAAAALGDVSAMRCAARAFGSVAAPQRLAAVGVLADRESRLSAVQRFAVVDAAARWLDDEAGDELAYALLAAVCESDVTTNQVYVALLAPPVVPERSGQ